MENKCSLMKNKYFLMENKYSYKENKYSIGRRSEERYEVTSGRLQPTLSLTAKPEPLPKVTLVPDQPCQVLPQGEQVLPHGEQVHFMENRCCKNSHTQTCSLLDSSMSGITLPPTNLQ